MDTGDRLFGGFLGAIMGCIIIAINFAIHYITGFESQIAQYVLIIPISGIVSGTLIFVIYIIFRGSFDIEFLPVFLFVSLCLGIPWMIGINILSDMGSITSPLGKMMIVAATGFIVGIIAPRAFIP